MYFQVAAATDLAIAADACDTPPFLWGYVLVQEVQDGFRESKVTSSVLKTTPNSLQVGGLPLTQPACLPTQLPPPLPQQSWQTFGAQSQAIAGFSSSCDTAEHRLQVGCCTRPAVNPSCCKVNVD